MQNELHNQAIELVRAGISIIPTQRSKAPNWYVLPHKLDADGNQVFEDGRAKKTWDDYQQRLPTEAELNHWFQHRATQGIAVVGGEVSGGLVVVDFDVEPDLPGNPTRFYEAFFEQLGGLASRLVWQKTGGGGFQALFRCENPGHNAKLAWQPAPSESSGRKIGIETRAEGGYALCAPSLHPSGNRYQWILNDPCDLPFLSDQEVAQIIEVCQALDEMPLDRDAQIEVRRYARSRPIAPEQDVIAQFNAAHDLVDLLTRHGYLMRGRRLLRPNADRTSIPGVTLTLDGSLSYHHSSNDPLNGFQGRAYHDVFDVWTLFEHEGNKKQAYLAAAELLGIELPGKREPVFNSLGYACCPDHSYRQLARGKRGGWYCQSRVEEGFCSFWWAGEDYVEPKNALQQFRAIRQQRSTTSF